MTDIRAQAYVKKNRLLVLGVADLDEGPVPFSYSSVLDEATEDGPIDFGAEMSPAIERALESSNEAIQNTIERGKMAMAAEALVVRARVGDQNAMAMLGAIRQSAKAGSERARESFKLIRDYIKRHPIEKANAAFAGDNEQIVKLAREHLRAPDEMRKAASILVYAPSIHVDRATVLVANGADLTDGKLVKLAARTLPAESRDAFRAGMAKCLRRTSRDPEYRAGQIVGRALRIQQVRQPSGKVALLSPKAAWELGE